MKERINLGKTSPEMYKKVVELDQLVSADLEGAGFTEGFCHLLKLRVSQINGCAFCMKMHSSDAVKSEESLDRLAVLSLWKETQYFTETERAALTLIEAITNISDGQISDDVYKVASSELTDVQISSVQWAGVLMNSWNRIAIASRYPVGV
ncbi:carboxymuconolactone decarboxylase family protein [Gilvimarinus sp. SDUM040013]|uniref:Carboxymuconolactone decarboxylase family protein n=1 Tax=Gilvimarinus gilvus TaxID=3058038 RepID=A0ABU4S3G2_9GAMM|nr:carboxymuconolactone decarboxylase family protein [Gilvimarinus sp. SDUM040013]MDO3384933.1 carboxymuconolactone decarboxylase family protein [Gilvimarinus sp. SDUM040013]MDX6851555.1 carboxymuconolactone decarboxylase family protein [Gilvimarinus sp. SDUM040013]